MQIIVSDRRTVRVFDLDHYAVTYENICGIKEEILISRLILFLLLFSFFSAASIHTRDFWSVLPSKFDFSPFFLSCKYGLTFVSSHLNESHSSYANSPIPLSIMYNKFRVYTILIWQWMYTGVYLFFFSSGVTVLISKNIKSFYFFRR